tara:strand:- start:524 stop:685 length:162 start_codon:yes stop_codon:yes gene_type:complete
MPTRREIQLEREKMIQEVYDSQIRVELLLKGLIEALSGGKSARKSSKSTKKTK